MKTILIFIFTYAIYAEPIQIAQLQKIYSNDLQQFSIGMYSFSCQPYGVITLEEILANKDLLSTCKQKIENYLTQNPVQENFIQMSLHLRQGYHVEFKESRCIVYAYGQKTISEALLERGLAVNKHNFKDDEFRYLYQSAQTRAKNKKIGIWSDMNLQTCVTSIYK